MLEHFTHKGDVKSPNIILDPAGVMEFQGRSLPENAKEIFTPVFEWMNKYSENPAQTTDINFKLEYFNTTSSKMIFEVLKIAESLIKDGHKVNLNWHYEKEDPDLKDEGVLISSNLDIELNFVEIDEFDFDHF